MRELEIGLCWGTLAQATLSELIEAAGRHGFPTLSVRPDMFLDFLKDGNDTKTIRQHLRDAGVRVQVIDAITAGLPGGRDLSVQGPSGANPGSAETCLSIAEELGAPIINVCHYSNWQGGPFLLEQMIECVGAITNSAAARDLRIVMEFVPDTGIPDIAAAASIVAGVGSPNCGLLLDPWHLARSGGTLDDVLALPPGTIGAFQLDDRTPPPPGTPYVPMTARNLPGEGSLPLIDLTKAALANNPRLTAEIEVFSAELARLPVDAAAARVKDAVVRWRDKLCHFEAT